MTGEAGTTTGNAARAGERDGLLQAIEDLDREHAAGEVDAAAYERLRATYVARAAEALRADADADAAADEPEVDAHGRQQPVRRRAAPRLRRSLGRRGVRRLLGAVLVVCVAGLVSLFALRAAGVRLPGETASGSLTLSPAEQVREQLQQAQELGSAGDVQQALAIYQAVLATDPGQPEALAYRGWLLRLTGLEATPRSSGAELVTAGRASIAQAVAVDPGYGDAHLFLGLSLLEDAHDLAGAVAQFRLALADHASAALLQATAPEVRQAFVSAHLTPPAGLPS